MMFTRLKRKELQNALLRSPAVVLLGPRQVGKTTLALDVALPDGGYLDLESPEDRNKLSNVEQYLRAHLDRLIVLDEVQRMPTLFEPLRGLIDRARRAGVANGSRSHGFYLLLGSASLDLIQRSSETLAGRIAFIELSGLHRLEVPSGLWDELWVRGGFPQSLTAMSDADSVLWRRDFTRTYLERDVAQFAPRTSAELLRRFWTMLAHLQGSTLNVAQLARNLDVDSRTPAGIRDSTKTPARQHQNITVHIRTLLIEVCLSLISRTPLFPPGTRHSRPRPGIQGCMDPRSRRG